MSKNNPLALQLSKLRKQLIAHNEHSTKIMETLRAQHRRQDELEDLVRKLTVLVMGIREEVPIESRDPSQPL